MNIKALRGKAGKALRMTLVVMMLVGVSVAFLPRISVSVSDGTIALELKALAAEAPTVPTFELDWGFPSDVTETNDYISIDTGQFRIEFYKGNYGYNKVFDADGNVLVYDDRLLLEIAQGAKNYKQIGVPQDITHVQVDDYTHEITRHYDDYNNTTYDITYTVDQDNPVKVTADIHIAEADRYRVAWYLSGIVQEEINQEQYGYTFGDTSTEDNWLAIDWNDVYLSFGDITASETETVANGIKASVYFDLGEVGDNADITLDPSFKLKGRTDREKLDACESLIGQFIDEYNAQGEFYNSGGATDDQWYIYAIRPVTRGGNVFMQYLKPMLAERDALKETILYEYLAGTGADWGDFSKEEQHDITRNLYGQKSYVRASTTNATANLLTKLQDIELSTLQGEIPPDPLEDFTTYTEVDDNSRLSKNSTTVTFTDWENDDNNEYVYYDKGASHFSGDFEHLIDAYSDYMEEDAFPSVWTLADTLGDYDDIYGDGLFAGYWWGYATDEQYFYLEEEYGSTSYYDELLPVEDDTWYYLAFERDEAVGTYGTLYLGWYEDSDYETLHDILSVTLHSKEDWRYIYSFQGYGASDYGDAAGSGYNANLDLQEIEIVCSPLTYGFGTVTESSTPYTVTDYFSITNNSIIQTDQTISVLTSTWSGGNGWTHSDTATAGTDQAGLLANRGGTWGVGDVIVKYSSPNYIYENCPAETDYDFGLKLIAPTEFTDGVQKTITVRISAAAG